MAKEPFEQFAMPNEVRAFVEQSVSQARTAFDGIAKAERSGVTVARPGPCGTRRRERNRPQIDGLCRAEHGVDLRFRAKADARQGRH